MSKYPALEVPRLSGLEPFHWKSEPSPFSVANFWQWSSSGLAANNLRGHLAEFLVASDLGLADGVRYEWDSCDIWTPAGYGVEVKSAAYIQQWNQDKLSSISFGIAPAQAWDYENQSRTKSKQRNSDAFVFCLLATRDQSAFEPMDLSQWQFFVVATPELDERLGAQKTLSLNTLKSLTHLQCEFGEISPALCKALSVTKL